MCSTQDPASVATAGAQLSSRVTQKAEIPFLLLTADSRTASPKAQPCVTYPRLCQALTTLALSCRTRLYRKPFS